LHSSINSKELSLSSSCTALFNLFVSIMGLPLWSLYRQNRWLLDFIG
jgi:hypothetical protein